MDFDCDCLLGRFQPFQLVCTLHSRTYETRCSRRTVCANHYQLVYRVMKSWHNVVHGTSG